MVTFLDEKIDYEFLKKAAIAPPMRKRCNALLRAMWRPQQRLHLSVDKKKKKTPFQVITRYDEEYLKNACRELQKHIALPDVGSNDLDVHWSTWMSKLPKDERFEEKRARQRQRTRHDNEDETEEETSV